MGHKQLIVKTENVLFLANCPANPAYKMNREATMYRL